MKRSAVFSLLSFLALLSTAYSLPASEDGVVPEDTTPDTTLVTEAVQSQYANLLESGTYTIQQQVNGRYMDAYESKKNDYKVMTRKPQNNNSQRWIITKAPGKNWDYNIQQKVNERFLAADCLLTSDCGNNDYQVVTRPFSMAGPGAGASQRWIVRSVDKYGAWTTSPVHTVAYTIQQRWDQRFLDAYESKKSDYRVVTRTQQKGYYGHADENQAWIIKPVSNNEPETVSNNEPEKCSNGYTLEQGDIPGWGKVSGAGGGQKVSQCGQCAELCDARTACKSYECSKTSKKCNLNTQAMPTRGSYKDYAFCRKGSQ